MEEDFLLSSASISVVTLFLPLLFSFFDGVKFGGLAFLRSLLTVKEIQLHQFRAWMFRQN